MVFNLTVSLTESRITMDTHLWACLLEYFQTGLAEEERPILDGTPSGLGFGTE